MICSGILVFYVSAENVSLYNYPTLLIYNRKAFNFFNLLDCMAIKIKRIDSSLPLPEYKTKGSAAFDLYSREDLTIPALSWALAPSNLILEIPKGQGLIISARSSLAKHYPGLILANGIGLIDSDYCGPEDEIKISLYNFTSQEIKIKKGDRIAQAFLVKYQKYRFKEIEEIKNKNRNGFGSTGLN